MRKTDQKRFQKILQGNRAELTRNVRRAMTGDMNFNPDDSADEIDSASSDSNLSFIGRLRERETVLLQKIELALEKIDEGTFGTCVACGEDIGLNRLKARPVAELCIDCKSQQETLEGRY